MLRHSTLCLALATLVGAALPALAAPKPAPKPVATPDPFKMPTPPPLPSIDKVPRPIPGVFLETSAEKPRVGIILTGTPKEFLNRLSDALDASRRFTVVDAGTALNPFKPKLAPGLDLKVAEGIRKASKVEMAVTCDLQSPTPGNLRVKARLFDLRTSEVSRELAIFGQEKDAATLAKTLASYIRQAAPLRCRVNRATEDEITLDLGKNDGVREESTFQIVRYPQNLIPVPVATVKITKTNEFRALAEVEDSRPGMTIAPGDVAIEDTGEFKI